MISLRSSWRIRLICVGIMLVYSDCISRSCRRITSVIARRENCDFDHHHFSQSTLSACISFASLSTPTAQSVIAGGPQTYATMPFLSFTGPSVTSRSRCSKRLSSTFELPIQSASHSSNLMACKRSSPLRSLGKAALVTKSLNARWTFSNCADLFAKCGLKMEPRRSRKRMDDGLPAGPFLALYRNWR